MGVLLFHASCGSLHGLGGWAGMRCLDLGAGMGLRFTSDSALALYVSWDKQQARSLLFLGFLLPGSVLFCLFENHLSSSKRCAIRNGIGLFDDST
ncbi:hypothetical protein VTH06DRAFT_2534 [Thermothelomyces fergusii]